MPNISVHAHARIYIPFLFVCVCVSLSLSLSLSRSLHGSLQRHLVLMWHAFYNQGLPFSGLARGAFIVQDAADLEYPTLRRSAIPEVVPSVELETNHDQQDCTNILVSLGEGWLTWKYIL